MGRGNGVYSFPVKLTARQIERLVKQGEVVHTECKDASGGLPDSLWESYSSFANTDGGVILLGVKEVDHKFSIAGVPKAATLIKRFWDGVNNREKVSVNILFDRHVYSVKCRGRDVVVIEVPRADRQDRPVYIGKDMSAELSGAMAKAITTVRASRSRRWYGTPALKPQTLACWKS